jgi:fluoride ion exporter CrcB/FEX
LTTVSTFIGELYALPPVPYAYIYAIASLGLTQAALILINGLHEWL